jgi:hypothetical protein
MERSEWHRTKQVGAWWDGRSPFPGQELKAAWVELLGRWAWEWFCTLTFAEPQVHPERADKSFRVWLARLNDARFGLRWRRRGKGVLWARGIEFQRRGSLHFHVLVARVGEVRRLSMMDAWSDLAGWARIRPVEHQDRVAKYVAKYVAKGGEIDLGGPGLADEPLPKLL